MAARTVLVVDDDPTTVEFLTMALEGQGYGVLSEVGDEAIELAREARPDVILLDLMMPRMDGFEVCRRLRGNPATAEIPIILMSAHDRLNSVSDAMAVNDSLPKPFHFGDLFAAVERWAHA